MVSVGYLTFVFPFTKGLIILKAKYNKQSGINARLNNTTDKEIMYGMYSLTSKSPIPLR